MIRTVKPMAIFMDIWFLMQVILKESFAYSSSEAMERIFVEFHNVVDKKKVSPEVIGE